MWFFNTSFAVAVFIYMGDIIIQIMHIIDEPNTKYEMQNDFTDIFKVAGIQQISDLLSFFF